MICSVADLTYHVVMGTIWIFQLIVETIFYSNFSHHSKTLEQMERAVDCGNIHIRISLFGLAEYFIHPHMASTLGYYGENQ